MFRSKSLPDFTNLLSLKNLQKNGEAIEIEYNNEFPTFFDQITLYNSDSVKSVKKTLYLRIAEINDR